MQLEALIYDKATSSEADLVEDVRRRHFDLTCAVCGRPILTHDYEITLDPEAFMDSSDSRLSKLIVHRNIWFVSITRCYG